MSKIIFKKLSAYTSAKIIII